MTSHAALAPSRGRYVEAFVTAPSPGIVAHRHQQRHYDSLRSYLDAHRRGASDRVRGDRRHGFVLQLDCRTWRWAAHRLSPIGRLSEFLAFVEMVVAAINASLRNVPRDRVRLHVCWGNYEGPHDRDVPLEAVFPIIRQADVGGFVLPFGNPRHAHEYRCLKGTPLADDQILVAGVIDTLTNVIEHPQVIADRLEAVAATIGDPRRVLAGTDCGFDTSAGNSRIAEDVAWGKLAALRDGARLASQRLFGD